MTEQECLQNFLNFMKLKDGTPIVSADLLDWLMDVEFFKKPAAIKHHGNYTGGLFEHSFEVAKCLVNMTEKLGLTWKSSRAPYIIGMFHDLCKTDDYVLDATEKWCYNKDKILNGHGVKSVMLLSQFINLTEEELMCIRFHMGAYETDDWESYDKAIRKYPNVLLTHTADMYASKVLNK